MAAKVVAEFHADMSKFIDVLGDRIDEFNRRVALSLVTNIIVGGQVSPGTPSFSGFARNGWMVSINTIGTPRQGAHNKAPLGKVSLVAMTEAEAVLSTLTGDAVVWITNNCAYIMAIENGSAGRSPVGMIALAIGGVQQLADQAAGALH